MVRFSDLHDSLNRNKVAFLKTDLDTALTFLDIASKAGNDTEKKRRNQINARAAYDKVIELLPKTTLSRGDDKDIADRLALLKLGLQKLGEVF